MPPRAAPALLERQAELDVVAESVRSLHSGNGLSLVIEGQPGIGKSALLAAARELAGAEGVAVLTARAGATEVGYPWGVARQLFDAALLQAPDRERAALLADAAALAAPALGFGDRRKEGGEFPTLHGLYWLTVNLSQRAPLLLALDDLHWCDPESLRFVSYLAARVHEIPVLLALASRRAETTPAGRRELLSRLAVLPHTKLLRPAPLSPDATRRLVQAHVGPQPTADFCNVCHEVTGGNPFLLGELLGDLRSERVTPATAAVDHVRAMTPEAISRSVLLRIAALPAPDRALVLARAVAVLGTGATATRVARLTEIELDNAIESLQSLIDGDILTAEPLSFSHPIVRGAVYEDFPALERSRLHGRAARVLAADGSGAPELTAHLLAAAPSASEWIVALLREAAEDARWRGAPGAAIACLRRALREPPPSTAERLAVLHELGSVEALRDPDSSQEHLAQALAGHSGPAERAKIAAELGGVQALAGAFTAAVDTIESALGELDGDAGPLRAALQVELLNAAHWDLATRPRTRALVAELERRSAGGEAINPRLEAYLAVSAAERGSSREQTVAHAERALESTAVRSHSSVAIRHVVTALAVCDELPWAEALALEWLANAQQDGDLLAAALASSTTSLLALLGGRISDSLAYARQSLAPNPEQWTPPFAVAWLIEALAERGELAEAERELAERGLADQLPQTLPFALLRFCRGRFRAARGEHQLGVEDLLGAGELYESLGIQPCADAMALLGGAVPDRPRSRLGGPEPG